MIVSIPFKKEVLRIQRVLKFFLQRMRLISLVNGCGIPGLQWGQEKALASIPLAFLIVSLSVTGSIAFGAIQEGSLIEPKALESLDEDTWVKKGYQYLQDGEYPKALHAFTQSIELGFSPYLALVGRGQTYSRLNRWDQAISDATRAIELEPHLPLGYMLRASAYDEVGRYREATADLTNAIIANPTDGKLYVARAIGFMHRGMPERALDDLDKAEKLGVPPVTIYFQRGMAHTDLGQYEQAIIDYSQALEVDPHHEDSLLGRGGVYRCIGHTQPAVNDTTLLISLNPNDVKAHVERGYAWKQLEKFDDAETDLEFALEHGYSDPPIYASLAHVYFSQDEFEEALEANQQAIDLDVERKFPYTYFQRGIMLLHLRKGNEAEVAFQRGIALAKTKRAFQVIEDVIEELEQFLTPESTLGPSDITMVKRVKRELSEMRAELGSPGEDAPRVCVK